MAGYTGILDIDIVGSRRDVHQMLDHLDSALSPVGMMLFMNGRVSPWLRQRAAERFRNEGDDAVGRWAPLSEVTQHWREHQGFPPSHPINRRTGRLEEYITNAHSDVVSAAGMTTLKFPGEAPADPWTKKKLATAQRGKDFPRTGPRPVLGLGETDLLHVLSQLAFHIQQWNPAVAP